MDLMPSQDAWTVMRTLGLGGHTVEGFRAAYPAYIDAMCRGVIPWRPGCWMRLVYVTPAYSYDQEHRTLRDVPLDMRVGISPRLYGGEDVGSVQETSVCYTASASICIDGYIIYAEDDVGWLILYASLRRVVLKATDTLTLNFTQQRLFQIA